MTADELSNEELEAYSRQIALDEIDFEGQRRLKKGHVLAAGAGGLGVPIVYQLTAMGAGHLRIVDRDVISMSDLHRQYLYDVPSVGMPKVEVAASKLSALNPRVNIEPVAISIEPWNVEDLLDGIDVVVDGLDSIEARYILNRACVKHEIPYVYGGAIRTQGNISTIIPNQTPCLECFHPALKDEDLPKCAVVGVYTPVLGIVASIEVSEAVRLLTGKQPRLAGKLLIVDASTLSLDQILLNRDQRCPTCSGISEKPHRPSTRKSMEEQCSRDGRRTILITPEKWLEVDLAAATDNLTRLGYTVDKQGKLGVTLTDEKGLTVSLLKTGVAIFQFPATKQPYDTKKQASTLYKELIPQKHKTA